MPDLYGDLKDSKTEIKGHTKDDALKEIDNGPGDPIAKTEEKKRLARMEASGAIKFDEGHRIRRESEPVKTQSSAAKEKVDMERFFDDFKRLANDLPVIKERHKYTKEEYEAMGREFTMEELQEKLPELFNGPEQLVFMNKDSIYIDEKVFNSLSEDKQKLFEEICSNKQIYEISQG